MKNKEQELLKFANENYPVGTKYQEYQRIAEVGSTFTYYETGDYVTDGHGGAVYDRGIWKQIIERGQSPELIEIRKWLRDE